jgi:hypothetical protein
VTDRVDSSRLFVAGLAVIAVGLGLLLGGAIGLVPDPGSLSGWLSPPIVALVFVLASVGVWLQTRSTDADLERDPLAEANTTTTPDSDRLGDQLETALESADEAGVRTALRQTAVTVLSLRTGCSRAAAADRLQRGDWTTDRIAAATLGGDEAAAFRADERVLATLLPRRTLRKRAEHTLDAIEAIDEEDAASEQSADQTASDEVDQGQSAVGSESSSTDEGDGASAGTSRAEKDPTSTREPQPVSHASRRSDESTDRVEGSLDA